MFTPQQMLGEKAQSHFYVCLASFIILGFATLLVIIDIDNNSLVGALGIAMLVLSIIALVQNRGIHKLVLYNQDALNKFAFQKLISTLKTQMILFICFFSGIGLILITMMPMTESRSRHMYNANMSNFMGFVAIAVLVLICVAWAMGLKFKKYLIYEENNTAIPL